MSDSECEEPLFISRGQHVRRIKSQQNEVTVQKVESLALLHPLVQFLCLSCAHAYQQDTPDAFTQTIDRLPIQQDFSHAVAVIRELIDLDYSTVAYLLSNCTQMDTPLTLQPALVLQPEPLPDCSDLHELVEMAHGEPLNYYQSAVYASLPTIKAPEPVVLESSSHVCIDIDDSSSDTPFFDDQACIDIDVDTDDINGTLSYSSAHPADELFVINEVLNFGRIGVELKNQSTRMDGTEASIRDAFNSTVKEFQDLEQEQLKKKKIKKKKKKIVEVPKVETPPVNLMTVAQQKKLTAFFEAQQKEADLLKAKTHFWSASSNIFNSNSDLKESFSFNRKDFTKDKPQKPIGNFAFFSKAPEPEIIIENKRVDFLEDMILLPKPNLKKKKKKSSTSLNPTHAYQSITTDDIDLEAQVLVDQVYSDDASSSYKHPEYNDKLPRHDSQMTLVIDSNEFDQVVMHQRMDFNDIAMDIGKQDDVFEKECVDDVVVVHQTLDSIANKSPKKEYCSESIDLVVEKLEMEEELSDKTAFVEEEPTTQKNVNTIVEVVPKNGPKHIIIPRKLEITYTPIGSATHSKKPKKKKSKPALVIQRSVDTKITELPLPQTISLPTIHTKPEDTVAQQIDIPADIPLMQEIQIDEVISVEKEDLALVTDSFEEFPMPHDDDTPLLDTHSVDPHTQHTYQSSPYPHPPTQEQIDQYHHYQQYQHFLHYQHYMQSMHHANPHMMYPPVHPPQYPQSQMHLNTSGSFVNSYSRDFTPVIDESMLLDSHSIQEGDERLDPMEKSEEKEEEKINVFEYFSVAPVYCTEVMNVNTAEIIDFHRTRFFSAIYEASQTKKVWRLLN